MKSFFKLIAVNFAVFASLWLAANLAVIAGNKIFSGWNAKESSRADLPNYSGVEWAGRHFEEWESLKSEYRSYVGWRRLPYDGDTIHIDSQGVRSTPQHEAVSAGSKLAVFLGGSTMWGTGSDDAGTIPAWFSRISEGGYRTLNWGESAYNALQGHFFLELQTMKGVRPDLIVAYDGVNQLSSFVPGSDPFAHSREIQIRNRMRGEDRAGRSIRHFFLEPLERIAAHASSSRKRELDLSPERVKSAAAALLESWQATLRLAKEQKAEFLAVLQPNAFVGSPDLKHLEPDPEMETMRNAYSLLYSEVRSLLRAPQYRELSEHFLDLSSVFDGVEPVYIDRCHVSPNGNKIIAEKIYARTVSEI